MYVEGCNIEINPGLFNAREIDIAGDISKASFLIAFGCLSEGANLIIESCLINASRMGFVNTLKKMGADIKQLEGGLVIKGRKRLYNTTINDFNDHRIAMSMYVL